MWRVMTTENWSRLKDSAVTRLKKMVVLKDAGPVFLCLTAFQQKLNFSLFMWNFLLFKHQLIFMHSYYINFLTMFAALLLSHKLLLVCFLSRVHSLIHYAARKLPVPFHFYPFGRQLWYNHQLNFSPSLYN